MDHFEIILNFVAEKYFCWCNTAAKSKLFNFAAIFQRHLLMLQTAKIFLKQGGATCDFFLALSMQNIALQAPEKDISPLNANPEKWSNTPKQIVDNLPTICLSVFDHFMNLALKGLGLRMLF